MNISMKKSKNMKLPFKNDNPMKFTLTEEAKDQTIFYIPQNTHIPLFAMGKIGYFQIWVGKKSSPSHCWQKENNLFYDVKGIKNAISGTSSIDEQFRVLRIIVIQFE